MRCTVKWNPRVWPYVTRCVHDVNHVGDHVDKDGRHLANIPGQVEAEEKD